MESPHPSENVSSDLVGPPMTYEILKENGQERVRWYLPNGTLATPFWEVGPEAYHRDLFIEYERSFGMERGFAYDVTHLDSSGFSRQKKMSVAEEYRDAIDEYRKMAQRIAYINLQGTKEEVATLIQEIKSFRKKYQKIYEVDAMRRKEESEEVFNILP